MYTAATLYSEGEQTNPGANTVLATTGAVDTGGILGANFFVSVILNGSVQMKYKLEALDSFSAIVETIPITAPANNVTPINVSATFFVPNGYTLRIRNDTGVLLGGTIYAAIILKVDELVDE